MLCGRLPEIYSAIRSAMDRLPVSVILEYADVKSKGRGWPIELQPKHLGDVFLRDKARWLSTLIESSDRVGGLQGLLDYSATRAPNLEPLALACRLNRAYMNRLVDPQSAEPADARCIP